MLTKFYVFLYFERYKFCDRIYVIVITIKLRLFYSLFVYSEVNYESKLST